MPVWSSTSPVASSMAVEGVSTMSPALGSLSTGTARPSDGPDAVTSALAPCPATVVVADNAQASISRAVRYRIPLGLDSISDNRQGADPCKDDDGQSVSSRRARPRP